MQFTDFAICQLKYSNPFFVCKLLRLENEVAKKNSVNNFEAKMWMTDQMLTFVYINKSYKKVQCNIASGNKKLISIRSRAHLFGRFLYHKQSLFWPFGLSRSRVV